MNDNAQRREELVNMLRDYQQRVAGWIARIYSAPADDDYAQSPDYQTALNEYRSFKQQEGVNYTVVIQYARDLLARYEATDKLLDEKADAIIKYLGGGSALVTLAALLSLKLDNWKTATVGVVAIFSLAPSLIAAVRAIHFAIKVRRPRASGSLPPVNWAIKMAEFYKGEGRLEINLWMALHPVCEAAYFRNIQKAKAVGTAHKCYQWAIGLLLAPVVATALCLLALLPYLPK